MKATTACLTSAIWYEVKKKAFRSANAVCEWLGGVEGDEYETQNPKKSQSQQVRAVKTGVSSGPSVFYLGISERISQVTIRLKHARDAC